MRDHFQDEAGPGRMTSVVPDILSAVDARVGDLIESATTRHHVRRLRRAGWDGALRGDGGGWAKLAPVRDGNSLTVHIDGTSALPAIAAAVRSARSFVHVAGWTVDPGFALERDPAVVTVRDLLAEAANRVDVRVLVWAGAPVPIMQPSRAKARELMNRLTSGTRIHGALDPRNRPMHCHHEKLVIVDGTLAFVGGIDLTALAGDRFDGAPHTRSTLG
jgi:phosphatidylserine/phosphatidylglycerophosphate/cardiolipin synthase-like enzyme